MLKVKAGQKGRPKKDVKDSTWIQSLTKFSFFSHKIWWYSSWNEIGDVVNNTEMGKVNKSVKMWAQILFKLSGSMFFYLSGKNDEESQCPACKVNTLKADISPSFDLQTLLSLFNPLSASIALI